MDQVTINTNIGGDLGVDGDDGVDLMEAFAEKYGVDITGFEISRYFDPEAGFNPISWLWALATRMPGLKIMRPMDLVLAAEEKRWIERTDFLTCYEYGTGGVWTYIRARNAAEIVQRYPKLIVFDKEPEWFTRRNIAEALKEDFESSENSFLASLREAGCN